MTKRLFEVFPVAGGKVVRLDAESELDAAELVGDALGEAYVYEVGELPVGWEGTDPEPD